MISKLLSTTALALAVSFLGIALGAAQPSDALAQTHEPTLNDIVRRIPIQSRRMEANLAVLSAVQEQVILHERKMRGEGLPAVYRAHFSANYSSILNALIDDRITEAYGRELLDVHRQLVSRAYQWSAHSEPDAEYGRMLIAGLKEVDAELSRNAEPIAVVPDSVRTPMVNGHQLWVEELMFWGCHCDRLSPGDISRLAARATLLERDERAFKRDGVVNRRERERLHARLIDLQRTLTEVLER